MPLLHARVALAVLTIGGVVLSGPALAQGFGFGIPVEERMGSEYGSEYYNRLYGPREQLQKPRASSPRCRTKVVETRSGPRRVRRCS
jgi:hypothetical protein